MEVILNEAEQRLCKFISKKRYENDRNAGAVTTVYGNQTAEQMELNSFGAELAFCKLFNTYPDLNVKHFGKEDAILVSGQKVDVKNTRYKDGKLMVKAIDREKCDLYGLMIGTFPTFMFVGFATAEELFKKENLSNEYEHPAYVLPQEKLNKNAQLL